MKTFKEFLSEFFIDVQIDNTSDDVFMAEESGMVRVTGKELQDKMRKRDFNALVNNKEFLKFMHKDKVFKYSFTSTGMHKIEVYPYSTLVKDDDGKVAIHSRHDFIVYNGKVTYYQRLSRSSNKDTTWR